MVRYLVRDKIDEIPEYVAAAQLAHYPTFLWRE
jgi:hypothetical protein